MVSTQVFQHRNRYFRLGAFLGLFVLLLSVGALGYLAYNRLNGIVETAAAASNPDNDLLLRLRSLDSDLSDAENHVMRYTLSRDEAQLQAFEQAKQATARDLVAFQKMPATDTAAQRLHRELGTLVNEKILLMGSQIELRENDRTDQVLDQLSRNLQKTLHTTTVPTLASVTVQENPLATVEQPPVDEQLSPEAQKERAAAFYRWMIGAPSTGGLTTVRKPDTVHPAPSNATTPTVATSAPPTRHMVSLPAKIEQQLADLTEAESDRYRENLERDLALTVRSQTVSGLIRQTMGQIDQMERKATAAKAQEVAATASTANTLIVVFCIVFPVLLLLLTLGIVSYFKSMQRHEASILDAKLQADALANARARFLATMSHEIRTPMNAIIGFSNQLSKTPLQTGQREHLELVQRASEHLLGVVNTVLDFSRLESGQMQYASQAFQLESEIDLVMDLLRPQFQAKGVTLKLNVKPANLRHLHGDPLRLRQILLNLLSNALKFTEKGAVVLTIKLVDSADGRLQMRFTVSDTGMGIPADRLDAIFRAFEQSDASICHRFGGSGLGLAITKMLVEQQGGMIGIISELGVGTSIWFTLPFEVDPMAQAIMDAQPGAHQPRSLRDKLALIVDDEPFNRRLLREVLATWGMQSVEVSNGQSALTLTQNQGFDVILMDLRMPDMDGIKATHHIRTSSKNQTTPIIMLTAGIQAEEITACLFAGANKVLGKPLAEAELHQQLEVLIGKVEASLAVVTTLNAAPVAHFSLRNLERMAGTNHEFVKEMVLSFVETARRAQAEIKEALLANDWTTIGEVAHRLAAPAKHLEAQGLYEALKSMEKASNGRVYSTLPQLVDDMDAVLETLLPSLQFKIAS